MYAHMYPACISAQVWAQWALVMRAPSGVVPEDRALQGAHEGQPKD